MSIEQLAGQTIAVGATTHAVERWIERVDHSATFAEARAAVEEFVRTGKLSGRPPRWVGHRRAPAGPGARYATNSTWPRIALLVTDGGAVLSVITEVRKHTPHRGHIRRLIDRR